MSTQILRPFLACALVAAVSVANPPRAFAQDAEVVIEWNRILQATIATPGALSPTVFYTRPYALMNLAIFEALNSIDPVYMSYATQVEAAPGASREAAAAQAAHDVLAAQFPNQRGVFAAALATTLNRLAPDAAREGSRVGAAAAAVCLDLRARDGWDRRPTEYLLPSLPGNYRVTPPQNAGVTFTHYPDVQPFIIGNRLQFLAGPAPALTSALYAADFNEVKALGSATSTTRTAEQTLIARLWATIGTSTPAAAVWNNVVRDQARVRGLSGLETARIYALLNMSTHDGLLVSFSGKFLYGLWRPVTAIRAADTDGNADTDADLAWTSLIPTPPYPAYPGNMACTGAVSSRLLALAFGRDDVRFTVTWAGVNAEDVTRTYNGFRQLGDEEARSRVYGGIHFTFDTLASFGVCTLLADYAFDNYLRARPGH
jgi:hypothetical protein